MAQLKICDVKKKKNDKLNNYYDEINLIIYYNYEEANYN